MSMVIRNNSFMSELELIKICNYFYELARKKKKFIAALNKNNIILDEMISRKTFDNNPIVNILENKKASIMLKADYVSKEMNQSKLSRNILELAIVSYRSEFQKNEKRKFKSKTKGFFVSKENFFCFKCEKKTRNLNDEYEEIVFFPNCNHFLHVSCNDSDQTEEFVCKKCLKNKNSDNKRYKKIFSN